MDEITYIIISPNGSEVYIKTKRTHRLELAMEAYCDRQGYDPGSVSFWFDGRPVSPNETPNSLNMQNNDRVDALPVN
jgi:small ubiquitin-related modifier